MVGDGGLQKYWIKKTCADLYYLTDIEKIIAIKSVTEWKENSYHFVLFGEFYPFDWKIK